jgi:hypothetical protein
MAAVTIPNAGTYDLLIDVGFQLDAFILDDPVKGLLDGTSYVLDGTTSYASVSEGTLNVSIKRGRQDENDAFTSGTMNFTLNDTLADGVFNPFDDSPTNPYYDQAQSVPGLAPGRAVQFIRYDNSNNPELLFVGFIVSYDYKFALDGNDTVTVFCVDNMYRLAQTFITGQNPSKEFTGDRINWVLDLPEVNYPTGAARNIDTGTVELGGSSQYAITDGQNVKAYFDQITYSAERGRIFIDREGVLVSQDRIGQTLGTPVMQFDDQGTATPYKDLSIAFRAEDIINLVEVSTRGSHTGTASDPASQSKYFIKTLFITDSLLESTSAAGTLANYLLEPEPLARYDSIETWYGSLTTSERDSAAIVDLGDYIIIEKEIIKAGTPTPFLQDLEIEGVEHRVDFARGHTSRYYTSPTIVVYQLLLDDPVYGIIDDENVLG